MQNERLSYKLIHYIFVNGLKRQWKIVLERIKIEMLPTSGDKSVSRGQPDVKSESVDDEIINLQKH